MYPRDEHMLETGSIGPDDVIGSEEYVPDVGSSTERVFTVYGHGTNYCSETDELEESAGRSYGRLRNDAERVLADAGNKADHQFAPLDLPASGGIDYLAQVFFNAAYNVKTWSVSATVGGTSLGGTIPAGSYNNNGSIGPRPNDGKRGKYSAKGVFQDGDVSAFIGINTLSTAVPSLLNSTFVYLYGSPDRLAVIPHLDIYLDDSDGIVSTEPVNEQTTAPVENANITFLGLPVRVYTSGSPGSVSCAITASERWSDSDDWVE